MQDNFLEHCLDKKYETTPRDKILCLPIEALQGISERQATLLKEALGVTTIEQLGRHAACVRAHAMTVLLDAKSGCAQAQPAAAACGSEAPRTLAMAGSA